MAQYITRRATNAAAVNTETQVNIDADGNTPGLLAPTTSLRQLIVTLGASIVAVGSAGSANVVRLKGAAMSEQKDITVGFLREDTTSTGGSKITQPLILDMQESTSAAQSLGIATLQGGVDPGSPEIEVTLVFP